MTLYDYLKMNNVKVSNKKQKLLGWIIRTIYVKRYKSDPHKTTNHSCERLVGVELNDYDMEFWDSISDFLTRFLVGLQQNTK
jgi:hypothetical protein